MGVFLTVVKILIVYLFGVRNVTAFYKDSYVKLFVEIKNPLIADLLISGKFSASGLNTDWEDRNKMPIIGVISYIYILFSIGPYFYFNVFLEKSAAARLVSNIFFLNLTLSVFVYLLNNFKVLAGENVINRRSILDKIGKGFDIGGLIFLMIILFLFSVGLIISIYHKII